METLSSMSVEDICKWLMEKEVAPSVVESFKGMSSEVLLSFYIRSLEFYIHWQC